MTLEDHVRADLIKLKARLADQGLQTVADLDYSTTYLRSTLWKKIRAWVFERDEHSCLVCRRRQGNPKWDEYDVHHRAYDLATLEGSDDSQLVTLCRRCHRKVEYFPRGEKRTSLADKEIALQRLISLHRDITEQGMRLRMVGKEVRGGTASLLLDFIGPPAFIEFHAVDSLLFWFVIDLIRKQRDLRTHMPFGADKLRQASGAKVLDRATNKPVIVVTGVGLRFADWRHTDAIHRRAGGVAARNLKLDQRTARLDYPPAPSSCCRLRRRARNSGLFFRDLYT
jgi:hypothetical protein